VILSLEIDVEAQKEKQAAASSSVFAAIFLTVLKLIIGLLTGSLGILAEAAHSGLDTVAALVTFFAVKFSDRPADEGHQYGHGKIENLSALIETLLLLLTCVWIIYEAIQRLFFKTVEVEASIWAFIVMVISIVVDISRSRMLYAAARKHNSQALEADALHFSTDIWSSSVVIGGLLLVWLSDRLGTEWGWLASGDAVAALAVALIVIYVSFQLGKRAISVLLDAAPPGLSAEITRQAGEVPGVQGVGPVRVRQAGASVFVDLTVNVGRSTPLEEAHQIAETVDERISKFVPKGDVVVHVDPVRLPDENLSQTVSVIATRHGLKAHNIHAHEVRGSYYVDLHVEVPSDLTLKQAHDLVSSLEEAVRAELSQIQDFHSHIEPLSPPTIPVAELTSEQEAQIRGQINAIIEEIPALLGINRFHIRPGPDGYDIVIHTLADPNLPITESHRLSELVETQIQAQIPGISEVLVHMEPAEEG
jgi:cation diffusion facilitator family transporter